KKVRSSAPLLPMKPHVGGPPGSTVANGEGVTTTERWKAPGFTDAKAEEKLEAESPSPCQRKSRLAPRGVAGRERRKGRYRPADDRVLLPAVSIGHCGPE